MLIIRQQQLDVLSRHMRRQFETRMADHLRSRFPEATYQLDDGTLHGLIVSAVARAESYGIEFEADLQRFLEYMLVLSWDFDTAPSSAWAGEILRRRELSGSTKISRIDNAYIFRYRTAATRVS
jgi:hypothetical protein